MYLDLAHSDELFYSSYYKVYGESSQKFLTTGFRSALLTSVCLSVRLLTA
jgi:hypothetical protein